MQISTTSRWSEGDISALDWHESCFTQGMRFLVFALGLTLALPLHADEPAPLRLRILSFESGPAPESMIVRVRGREAHIPIERVNLNRADPFTLLAARGRRLPILELMSSSGAQLAVHEGRPNSTEAWVREHLEARSDSEIDYAPPIRTVATGEWSGRSDDARAAVPTSPSAIPEKHRWIFEEIAPVVSAPRVRAGES